MKKRRIVLASLLKPLNDTRMFEKMGVSLARTEAYEVHVIGYPSREEMSDPSIHFHPLPKFSRLGFGRIRARLKALQFAIKVKPELLIVTTHELLGVAILIRILFGARIIYDIQENYYRNILYTHAFPRGTRTIIASLVRFKERIISPFIHHFILAEKGYLTELSFVKNKCTVIENKCQLPAGFQRKPGSDFIELIFSGTLAESSGVFLAIDLAKKLHSVESKIKLTLIGYCAQDNVLRKIKREISGHPFITLRGGHELVAHTSIMNALATANFGIIAYPVSPHIKNKIPTKLYEYLACELPILLQNHPPWTAICAPLHASITLDFENPDIGTVLGKIHADHFYLRKLDGMTWSTEEQKLLDLVRSIF